MATDLRTWDWNIEAAAMAAKALDPPEPENRVYNPKLRTQVVNTIRMTAAAWSLVHREAPSPRSIATVLREENETAWLMENAMREQPRNGRERQAIKEITAWYKQEWQAVSTVPRRSSGRLDYFQRGKIIELTRIAAGNASGDAEKPLKQLKPGSAEREAVAQNLDIVDIEEGEAERESRSFAEELVSTLEAQAEQAGDDRGTMARVAWCARQALQRSRSPRKT